MNTTAREAATIPAPETPVPATTRTAPPDALRHYILERRTDGTLWELGRGGMGVTYKAIDVNLHCPVALKIIGPQCFGSEISRRRFIREARLAAQIRHPNVAAVFHLDTQDDDVFYSMEFVDGITADDWVKKRGPMSVELALDVAMQVCRALAAAHHIKLVHRDIKPGNIMLLADPADHGRVIVKVIDFGLALSQMNDAMTTTTTCAFVGTPQFSSPEQVDNLELDIRSDIYSLGCTLWFLLAGQAPFTGSVARVLSEQLTRVPPFDDLNRVPRPVTTLLRRMLEKRPEARPQTPMDLHSEICQCRENLSRQAATARLARIPFNFVRNAWHVAGMRYACYALLAGGCCASALWMSSQPADAQVDQPLPPGVRLAASTVALPTSTPLPEAPPSEPSTSIVPGLPAEITALPRPPESPSGTNPDDPGDLPQSITLAPMDQDDAAPPFWMVLRPPDPAVAMNLTDAAPVALTIPGPVAADPKVTPPKTTSRQTSKRRSQNVERRSSPFEPVQRAGRTVRNFVHRFF